MAKICITGGTGLVGTRLTSLLVQQGHQVLILSRQHKEGTGPVSRAAWAPDKGQIDAAALRSCDAIIHLAGANVAEKRWTSKRKALIRDSRVQSSRLLVETLRQDSGKVQTVVSSSAIGWYGPDQPGAAPFTEAAPAYTDFLGATCKEWEAEMQPLANMGIRLSILRTGIVLSNEGGALVAFRQPLQWGVAAIIGNGSQMISWIHVDDLCRMYMYALEEQSVTGIFNAVAPQPESNSTLTLTLAKKLRGNRFISIPVPAFVLKIVLGEMSIEVLKSTTVSAAKIQEAGFRFLYPSLTAALHELTGA